jgi:hypothetical protein
MEQLINIITNHTIKEVGSLAFVNHYYAGQDGSRYIWLHILSMKTDGHQDRVTQHIDRWFDKNAKVGKVLKNLTCCTT